MNPSSDIVKCQSTLPAAVCGSVSGSAVAVVPVDVIGFSLFVRLGDGEPGIDRVVEAWVAASDEYVVLVDRRLVDPQVPCWSDVGEIEVLVSWQA
jgi:hypothetical protein